MSALDKVVRLSHPRRPSGFIELYNHSHDEHGRFGFSAGDRVRNIQTGQRGVFVRAGRPAGAINQRTGRRLPSPTHIVHWDGNSRDSHVHQSIARPVRVPDADANTRATSYGTRTVRDGANTGQLPGDTLRDSSGRSILPPVGGGRDDSDYVARRTAEASARADAAARAATNVSGENETPRNAEGRVLARTSANDPIDPYLGQMKDTATAFHQDPANDIVALAPRGMSGPDDAIRDEMKTNSESQYADFSKMQASLRTNPNDTDNPLYGKNSKQLSRMANGLSYMDSAIASRSPVIIATHDGLPAAAINYTDENAADGTPGVHIGVLGSNQMTDGAASAVQVEVARMASAKNPYTGDTNKIALRSTAVPDAAEFHAKVGRIMDQPDIKDKGSGSRWSIGDVRKIAALDVGGGLH